MTNCLFCNIINGDIPSSLIYEDEKVIAFEDINPQAPVHYLVIPREHIKSMAHTDDNNKELLGHILLVAARIAKDKRLDSGYRIVNNCGIDGGQTVDHLHFHILGERTLLWPPG